MGLLDSDLAPVLGGLLGKGWDRFRGVDPATGEADYWKRGGLAGLLGMPSWDEQPKTDIAMGFAGSTTPAVKGIAGGLAAPTKGIRAYHRSPYDFDQFDPSRSYRKASFFAATPEQAGIGATAGAGDMYGMRPGWRHTYEVEIKPGEIEGLNYTPVERKWFDSLPERIADDDLVAGAMRTAPNKQISWDDVYSAIEKPDGRYFYVKKSEPPSLSYEQARETGRDVYGWQFPHYGGNEAEIAKRVAERGMSGYAISDEAGLSLAITNPDIIKILRKYGLLGPMAGGAVAGAAGDY